MALKAAKAALDEQDYGVAIKQAAKVLVTDPQNYHANVFLGLALGKQGKYDEAAGAYTEATQVKPNEALAWQGLIDLYDKQGRIQLDGYRVAAVELARIYMEADDRVRCQAIVDKFLTFAKEHGTRTQYKQALELLLPTSTLYDYLEGRIPNPAHTYSKIAAIIEADEKERVNKEIGERRTRFGAKIGQVKAEVNRDVLAGSALEQMYQSIIDWSTEDDVRRRYEEKLLQRAYDVLLVLPAQEKAQKREQVWQLARGIVILKHPFELAWEIVLEWHDGEELAEWDAGILREFIEFFPQNGLAKVIQGYITSDINSTARGVNQGSAETKLKNKDDNHNTLSAEDRLLLMTDGVYQSTQSSLAHRLLSEYYLSLEEYEGAVDTARKAYRLAIIQAQACGLKTEQNIDAINITLATSLIHYQSPRNHSEAKSLFDEVLERKPLLTPALIGIGLILEDQEDFVGAIDFLTRAIARDPSRIAVRVEAAWCNALNGDFSLGLGELETCLLEIDGTDSRTLEMRAQTLYRIGICIWELDPSKRARKDRKGAYSRFLSAIQANMNYAPAYTSLGIYYSDYAKDRARARKCFQKAFELSPSEIEAAQRLAQAFADQRDWDLVEIVAQRVVDSGKVRPSPGSRRKAFSWPYAALGVVQLNRQDYAKSIVSFQSALRISPAHYHSWVGLGESYHNSGRYIAATKAFQQSQSLESNLDERVVGDTWFAKYMLANVKRELGDHSEAIIDFQEVLRRRPNEFGVSIALLQTFNEASWRSVELGFFGRAVEYAREAITLASTIAGHRVDAFNLWKGVGDACSIFSWVRARTEEFPVEQVRVLLKTNLDTQQYDSFADIDGVGRETVKLSSIGETEESVKISQCLDAAMLAQKRAIYASANDVHAQAVAWYNLGWTEHRAHACCASQSDRGTSKRSSRFLKAAIRCFKRAIELEAGNAEFWNALGIVTSQLNPKVAQHCFVRSLHLNDKSAGVWTNLGALYLIHHDYQVANDAFTRAQSTDPDYAQAWLGQGLLALLVGDNKEAQYLFTHAFEIADSSSLLVKRQYGLSVIDHVLSSPSTPAGTLSLIQPLFALQQLQSQMPNDLPYTHLSALLLERIGNHCAATDALATVCAKVEAEYEVSESPISLGRFAKAKADLARVHLAAQDYSAAAENAEMALDLSSDEDNSSLDASARQKCRLSAHLTAGLAYYYTKEIDQAIEMFRSALEESDDAADIVCLLVQVLWAKGGEEEILVAREQLLDCVEKQPGHIGVTLLLGVIAVLDNDTDTLEAVESNLQAHRISDNVDNEHQRRIDELLVAIATLVHSGETRESEEMAQSTKSVMLAPAQPHGWSRLAAVTADQYPPEMALKMALRSVPPGGSLQAKDLAKAFAGTARVADSQRAIVIAPWAKDGWEELARAIV
ncbi:MAG: Superkiller protein 3 [Candelina submexicana]|nr:MAG: Superkiller protein 3 [Candelina submexicana]